MDLINFAIVGCGRVAERHISAINKLKNAKLVAVCDIDTKRSADKASFGKVPGYANYHELLRAHPEVSVVILLTPSGSHFEHAKDILCHYKKHLMIEKPFVMLVEEAIELKELADKYGTRIFPVYQNRYNKAVRCVKDALKPGGKLGKIRVGTVRVRWCRPQRYYDLSPWRGTWAMDGGALTNQGIHYIDLLRYLCGEVKRVHAKLATLGANIEVEDTGVAILEFESGALGVIEIMTSARPDDFEASISCVCSEGLAVISGIATNKLQTFSVDKSQEEVSSEEFVDAYGFGHDLLIQNVADSLLEKKNSDIEFYDGLQTIRLIHALYKSDEIGGWVDVKEAGNSVRLGKKDEFLSRLYRTPFINFMEMS